MPDILVRDSNNQVIETIRLRDDLFGGKVEEGTLHQVVVNFLANQRQGTHSTKTRGRVSGGGKKPYRQKHTGRARAGSIRSPLWRGGGTIFGPLPRDYSYTVPQKMKRRALMTALLEKLSHDEVVVLDAIALEKPKTKEMVAMLKRLGLDQKRVLIVLPEKDESVIRSARNIPGIRVTRMMDLNTYDVLSAQTLLMTKDALQKMEGMQSV